MADFADLQEDMELQRVHRIFDILHGTSEADLLIKNVQTLDVFGECLFPGSLLIDGGQIVALNPDEAVIRARETFDGKDLYAIPGLIDAHFHFDSQLAHPAALAEVMVPRGTTTCFVEILDLISAAKEDGVQAGIGLFKDYRRLPYRIFAFAPGKKVSYEISREIMWLEPVIGMGEFNHFSYREGNEEDFRKAALARKLGAFMNGHWGLTALSPLELNYLPAIGVSNNHDVWNSDDIARSLRHGFPTQIKFGVGNVRNLLSALISGKYPPENFELCSDNVSVSHMKNAGHMDYAVNLAIEMGMDPIKAIKMASFYAANHFKMADRLGSLAPGRYADIVLTDSLSKVNPIYVFLNGRLVAERGKLLDQVPISYSAMRTPGVPGCASLNPQELEVRPLQLSPDGCQAEVYLFDLFGRGHAQFYRKIWLPVENGRIVEELNGQHLVRISVIERYPEAAARKINNGYFVGVQIDEGAVATSFSAPKSYIVVIGRQAEEMHCAVQQVDAYSGACVVTRDAQPLAALPIEIYGIMADLSAEELLRKSDEIDRACRVLGHANSGEPVVNKLLSLFISLHRFQFME
jgi:adenine deaminase